MNFTRNSSALAQASLPYLVLIAIYTIVHGLLLLNGSYFWDDWIWKLNPAELNKALTELGFVFFKETFQAVYTLNIYSAKAAIFTSYLVAGLALYKSLDSLQVMGRKDQLLVALLFLILPYNIVGRSTLSTFTYGITLACFLSGYLCYLQFRLKKSWILGVLALVLITLSFNTGSFLVFSIALIALTELHLQKARARFSWARIAVVIFAALAHAAVFFLVKKTYFPTSGPYAAYNQVALSLPILLKFLFVNGPTHFFEPLMFSLVGKNLLEELQPYLKTFLYFAFLIAPVSVSYLKKRKVSLALSLAGVGLLYAADFPYMMVGKAPETFSWNSRHQLLLPLGAALWLTSVLLFWESRKRNILAAICAVVFGIGTMRLYLGVQGLGYQDLILQTKLGEMVDKDASRSYFVDYKRAAPSLLRSGWDFYELTGMLYARFGHQKNSIVMSHQAGIFQRTDIDFFSPSLRGRYMLNEAGLVHPGTCINITERVPMSEARILHLMTIDFFQGQEALMKSLDEMYIFTQSTVDSHDLKSIRCS